MEKRPGRYGSRLQFDRSGASVSLRRTDGNVRFCFHDGASKLGLKVVEVPIRYASRTYGETQISRFRHGVMLFRMVLFAFLRIKAL